MLTKKEDIGKTGPLLYICLAWTSHKVNLFLSEAKVRTMVIATILSKNLVFLVLYTAALGFMSLATQIIVCCLYANPHKPA